MIRKAVRADAREVNRIYQAVHDREEAGETTIGWIRSIYPTLQTAYDALERDDLYVMEENGEIVAAAIINQTQVPEYVNADWKIPAADDEVLVLHTLVVDSAKGRAGLGSAFVAFYARTAADMGCRALRMDTNEINTRARKLYKKLGFEEIGIVPCVFNGIPNVHLVCLERAV